MFSDLRKPAANLATSGKHMLSALGRSVLRIGIGIVALYTLDVQPVRAVAMFFSNRPSAAHLAL